MKPTRHQARQNVPLRRELEAMIIHSMTRQRDILPSAISSFSESRREEGVRLGEIPKCL